MTATTIASWLLTYLVHSTVFLVSAWLISRVLGDRRLVLQETLLRLALIGGLLTTVLQLGLGVQPLAGKLEVATTAVSAVPGPQPQAISDLGDEVAAAETTEAISHNGQPFWPVILLALWGVGSAVGLFGLGRSMLDLRRLLRTRQFRPVGRIVERLAAAMGLRSVVRMSTSKAIAVPFATGIRHPEICCPERICDLAEEHRTGLFAHELAHLARRDPAWQLLYRVSEAVLILQPLNRLVRRRLEEIAEHLTDERAVACTGNRLGLARCLVVLAHWGKVSRLGAPAAAFADGPRLDRRITRLIGGKMSEKSSPWTLPFVIVIFVAAGLILPAVAPVSADSSLGSDTPLTLPEKTWSTAEDAPREAPPEAPSPPNQPAPPDERAPQPPTAPAVPEAAPAPAAATPATDVPVAETAPEPVAQPARAAPAAKPVPASGAHPAPVSQPVQPTQQHRPSSAEEDERIERGRQRAERAAREAAERDLEARKRAVDRARAEAERQARRAEFQELRFREAEERARERAHRTAEDRERIKAEQRRRIERARITARDAEKCAAEHRARAEDRARERARLAAAEARTREEDFIIERERAIRERARVLAEEARRLAEEAEQQALEKRNQRED